MVSKVWSLGFGISWISSFGGSQFLFKSINSIEKLLILHLVNEFWVYQPYCMRFGKCMATLGGQSFYNFQSFPFGAHFYYTVIHTVEMGLLIKMSILSTYFTINKAKRCCIFRNVLSFINHFLCKMSKKLIQRKISCHFYCSYVT